jgi:hypothetical protein
MTREHLEHAIQATGAIRGDRELYIVGSQAILGSYRDANPELLRSMEVDIAPKNRPELESLIEGSIGELSPFHKTFGFHLPGGWQERVVVVDNTNTNGFRGLCLEPADLAVSELAAGRSKDIEFVRIMLRERRPEVLHERIHAISQVDEARKTSLHDLVSRLAT